MDEAAFKFNVIIMALAPLISLISASAGTGESWRIQIQHITGTRWQVWQQETPTQRMDRHG